MRFWVGAVIGLGPSRKRIVSALACGHRLFALHGGPRTPQNAQGLDTYFGFGLFSFDHPRNFYDPKWCFQLGTFVYPVSDRPHFPGILGGHDRALHCFVGLSLAHFGR